MNMLKKYFRYALLVLLVLVFLFIDRKISLGILLGYIFYHLNQRLLVFRVDSLLKANKVSFLTYLGSISGFILLIIPILISFIYPNIFNWIGVFIGLIYEKLYLYISSFVGVSND